MRFKLVENLLNESNSNKVIKAIIFKSDVNVTDNRFEGFHQSNNSYKLDDNIFIYPIIVDGSKFITHSFIQEKISEYNPQEEFPIAASCYGNDQIDLYDIENMKNNTTYKSYSDTLKKYIVDYYT